MRTTTYEDESNVEEIGIPEKVEKDDDDHATSSLEDEREKTTLRKNRKHKAFFMNYPFVPRINRRQPLIGNYDKNNENYEHPEPRKKISNKKRYPQESQIYYIKLPPTPYTYVPGFGYISQPPTYSSPGIHRPINHIQRPIRPNYQQKPTILNPFIKLPVDFVSNGKPTGVYQWPAKRRESTINRLNEPPYLFNGRPTSLYMINSSGQKTGHQPFRLADPSNHPYYWFNVLRYLNETFVSSKRIHRFFVPVNLLPRFTSTFSCERPTERI